MTRRTTFAQVDLSHWTALLFFYRRCCKIDFHHKPTRGRESVKGCNVYVDMLNNPPDDKLASSAPSYLKAWGHPLSTSNLVIESSIYRSPAPGVVTLLLEEDGKHPAVRHAR